MSGRRRHDDGWDGGRPNAQDDGPDPWADDSIGEWDDQPAEAAEPAGQPRTSARGAAGAYVRGGQPGSGKAYAAPDFPSFRAVDGSPGAGRHGSDHGNASQRRSSDGHAPSGYGSAGYRTDGYRDAAGYDGSRPGYPSSGYGRAGSNANSAGRRDSAGYDAAQRGGDSAAGWYQQSAKSPGSRGNDSGHGGGQGSANGRGYVPEFMPIDNDDADDDGSATARPYGRLSIYTLREDKAREFDRLAERAAEGVRTAEPDTLVYVIHVVPKAPQQRIIYEIYRDRAALMSHERQPHIRQFAADRASCVVATNVIDLRLKFAKVAALGPPSQPAAQGPAAQGRAQQAGWAPRGAPTRQAPAQPSPTPHPPVPTSQPSPAQPQGTGRRPPGTGARVASFTPAPDRSGSTGFSGNQQYPPVSRDAKSQAPQYGNSGGGANGAGSTQYGAANSNGYSRASGYANGGSYSSSSYQSSNRYPGTSGYQSASGGRAGANGYSGSNGYQSGNGANGYGSGYSNSAANSGGNGAASYSASASTQYAPRYRELASGASPEAGGTGSQQGNADRYTDDGGQADGAQPPEWEPRTRGYR